VDTLTLDRLTLENDVYRGSAGVSAEGRALGFSPAFLDRATRTVYPSRYADGRPAPFHVLDGLPAALVVERNRHGRPVGVRASVISGFVRGGKFYTRAQAARAAAAP
jgi:hypothetical protein